MDSKTFNKLIRQSGHVVKTELLKHEEPVTIAGWYCGEYKERKYYYRAGVRNGQVWSDNLAMTLELRQAFNKYIEVYYQTTLCYRQGWDLYYEGFWDEDTLEDQEKLVKAGVIPSEEDFVLQQLGIFNNQNGVKPESTKES